MAKEESNDCPISARNLGTKGAGVEMERNPDFIEARSTVCVVNRYQINGSISLSEGAKMRWNSSGRSQKRYCPTPSTLEPTTILKFLNYHATKVITIFYLVDSQNNLR